MDKKTGSVISQLVNELDSAVMRGDIDKADEIADILYVLQGGTKSDATMPEAFPESVMARGGSTAGGQKQKPKRVKRIISIAAAAALITALSMTALATNFFGLRDMVIKNDKADPLPDPVSTASDTAEGTPSEDIPSAPEPSYDLIPLQGYPDSNEFKASAEWNIFLQNYDTNQAILNQVGNSPNEYTEKYPVYYVYSKEMADKLEEIAAKYGLELHHTMTIAESEEQLLELAGAGNFLESKDSAGVNRVYSGYVYDDGTFHYDGQAVLFVGKVIEYQLGNYVKGTFSEPFLNIGDADAYREWHYTTKTGVQVSLALSETKALLIADRDNSFVVVNVLAGTGDSGFGSDSITEDDLQSFADMFDFTQLK